MSDVDQAHPACIHATCPICGDKDPREVPSELGRAIARAIAESARVVLVQHGIVEAEKLARELGNNCAHGVFLIVERFLEDGTITKPESE